MIHPHASPDATPSACRLMCTCPVPSNRPGSRSSTAGPDDMPAWQDEGQTRQELLISIRRPRSPPVASRVGGAETDRAPGDHDLNLPSIVSDLKDSQRLIACQYDGVPHSRICGSAQNLLGIRKSRLVGGLGILNPVPI
jgi:hypothetical protein